MHLHSSKDIEVVVAIPCNTDGFVHIKRSKHTSRILSQQLLVYTPHWQFQIHVIQHLIKKWYIRPLDTGAFDSDIPLFRRQNLERCRGYHRALYADGDAGKNADRKIYFTYKLIIGNGLTNPPNLSRRGCLFMQIKTIFGHRLVLLASQRTKRLEERTAAEQLRRRDAQIPLSPAVGSRLRRWVESLELGNQLHNQLLFFIPGEFSSIGGAGHEEQFLLQLLTDALIVFVLINNHCLIARRKVVRLVIRGNIVGAH
mmetsp:Transcript_22030/g.63166  ORF Transcript_22030/g.63166 Transcript_22030/m.63166 type:complete len:256 (+) Transcript_22030:65-832(+)